MEGGNRRKVRVGVCRLYLTPPPPARPGQQGFDVEMKGKMGKLVHSHGFHSQPPNFYEQREPLHDLGDSPITFHSLDGPKQKDRGKRAKSKVASLTCGDCPELYTQLYERNYLGIKNSTRFVEDNRQDDIKKYLNKKREFFTF